MWDYKPKSVTPLSRNELVAQRLDTSWQDVVDLSCHRGACDCSHYGRSALWTDGTHALFSVGLRVALVDMPSQRLLRSWRLTRVEVSSSLRAKPAAPGAKRETRWATLDGTDALTLTPDRRSVLAIIEFSTKQVAIVRFDATSRAPVTVVSCFVSQGGRPGIARFARNAGAALIQRDGRWLRCRVDADSLAQAVPASLVPTPDPQGYGLDLKGPGRWAITATADAGARAGDVSSPVLMSAARPVWSADGSTLLTNPTGSRVELINPQSGARTHGYTVPLGNPVDQVAFLDPSRVAAGMPAAVDIWDLRTASIVDTLRYEQSGSTSSVFPYPHHSKLLYSSSRDLVSIRNLAAPPLLRWTTERGRIRLHEDRTQALTVYVVGSHILYATEAPTPSWLRELGTGRRVKRLPLPISEVSTPALSHKGDVVAGWDAEGAMALHRAPSSGGFSVKPALRWSPSGELLEADVHTVPGASSRAMLLPSPILSDDASLLAWRADREILVVRTSDGGVKLRKRIESRPWYLVFDPSGQWLSWAECGEEPTSVNLLNVADGTLHTLGFLEPLTSPPAFSEDGKWLAVGAHDGLMLVDRISGKWQFLHRVEHQPTALGVMWSEDGTVHGSPDARRITWVRSSTDLLAPLVSAGELGAGG